MSESRVKKNLEPDVTMGALRNTDTTTVKARTYLKSLAEKIKDHHREWPEERHNNLWVKIAVIFNFFFFLKQ